MNTQIDLLEKELDESLPDKQILSDARNLLTSNAQNEMVSFTLEKQTVNVPIDSHIDIVTKAFFKEYYEDVGFGVFRVLVAIGGFLPDKHGFHEANYCFATLYYNSECQLINSDVHKNFR